MCVTTTIMKISYNIYIPLYSYRKHATIQEGCIYHKTYSRQICHISLTVPSSKLTSHDHRLISIIHYSNESTSLMWVPRACSRVSFLIVWCHGDLPLYVFTVRMVFVIQYLPLAFNLWYPINKFNNT